MRALIAIAQKDLRLLFRDKGDVFFTFVFPVILAVFFGFVFGGGGGASRIDLALVVESDTPMAAGMAADLTADPSFEVVRHDSRETAIAAVRVGKATAAVILPASMKEGVEGLFTGSGIPIHAPERIFETKPDYLLILPWNLKREIMEQMAGIRDWGGQFVTPVPEIAIHS